MGNMKELWLKYVDEEGEAQRILIEQNSFTMGRHSGNDLSVASGKLSREHAKIDSFSSVFVISDLNSSNGTTINGEKLDEPKVLENGDLIDLGGGLQIEVEIPSDEPEPEAAEEKPESDAGIVAASSPPSSAGENQIPTSFFFVAPILALVVLLCAGGGLFIAYSDNSGSERSGRDTKYSTPDRRTKDRDEEKGNEEKTTQPKETPKPEDTPGQVPEDTPVIEQETPETPGNPGEENNIKAPLKSFLTRTVPNDPNAFLLDKNIKIMLPTLNSFKGSAALASNLKDAKTNSAEIESIANQSNLTPQFLAAAALANIGNQRGDVVKTAREMAGVLQAIKNNFRMESADEAAVVVASYFQGKEGKTSQMRNVAESLSKTTEGVGPRKVRTIWFLHEKGKLSSNEFDLALRFLAIGTIMQNPEAFNVKAEAVIFN